MKYIKDNPRITVTIYNADTEEVLLKIQNKNWMNVGEVFTQHHVTELISHEFNASKKLPPKNILVMIAEEFTLED